MSKYNFSSDHMTNLSSNWLSTHKITSLLLSYLLMDANTLTLELLSQLVYTMACHLTGTSAEAMINWIEPKNKF